MRTIRSLSVAVLAAGVLLAAGCTADKNTGKPAAKASASAAASSSAAAAAATGDLKAAVRELAASSYKYALKAGDASGDGSVDPAAKQTSMSIAVAAEGEQFRTQLLSFDTELFARITGLPLPGLDGRKWLRIDRTKVKSFGALGIKDIDDPTGVKTLSTSIATIEKTGDRSYKGTLDLSKGSAAFGLDDVAVRELGTKARAVPFEATVNAAGKLETWKMTIPAHGSEKETPFTLTYSEHGGTFTVPKPAGADVVNPPQAIYDMLQT